MSWNESDCHRDVAVQTDVGKNGNTNAYPSLHLKKISNPYLAETHLLPNIIGKLCCIHMARTARCLPVFMRDICCHG